MSGRLRITLCRSRIGLTPRQRQVLRGLGLRRINSSVLRGDTAAIRGMVAKVAHLVRVEPVAEEALGASPPTGLRTGEGQA